MLKEILPLLQDRAEISITFRAVKDEAKNIIPGMISATMVAKPGGWVTTVKGTPEQIEATLGQEWVVSKANGLIITGMGEEREKKPAKAAVKKEDPKPTAKAAPAAAKKTATKAAPAQASILDAEQVVTVDPPTESEPIVLAEPTWVTAAREAYDQADNCLLRGEVPQALQHITAAREIWTPHKPAAGQPNTPEAASLTLRDKNVVAEYAKEKAKVTA